MYEIDKRQFGMFLSQLRKEKRLTQRELAAQFADAGAQRAQPKGKRLVIYLTCVLIAATELVVLHLLEIPFSESLMTAVLFPIAFCAYFWLFVQTRLPGYYDSNKISNWSDGPLRMNVPGVTLTNRNWPYIVKALRIWSAVTMTVYPLIHLAGVLLLPDLWTWLQLYVFLSAILGGMLLPLIVVGRKYQ